MKWGRKKLSSSSSCTRPHLISHVFPISWLSKFKRMNISSESKPAKEKLKVKQNSASMSSPKSASGVGERFYSGDGDAFWRLSFGEEGVEGKTSRGVSRSVLYDSDDELEVPPSSFRSCGSNDTKVMIKEDSTKFDNVVRDVKKMRELDRDVEISPEIDICGRVKGAVIKTPRKRIEKEMKLRKANQRVLEEKWLELETESHEAAGISTKSVEKDVSEMESVRTIWTIERENCKSTAADSRKHRYVSSMNSRNTNLRTIEEECVVAAKNYDESDALSAEKMSLDWQKLKEMKIEELKLKNDKQRKSLYISRELPRRRTKQNSRVRVNSPRTPSKVEICKIKAIEDMKKAKLKMRKKAKERTVEKYSGLESFAVVKCSFDPQKDFRDSMIEMIMEKRISRPEELEELLACYLTLNSDEYHDLIIKVFRQVWFDMNQASFSTELQNEQCCND